MRPRMLPTKCMMPVAFEPFGSHRVADFGGFLLGEETVREQLPIERRRVDAEDLGRTFLLAAGIVQDLEDVLPLQLVQRERRVVDDEAAAALRALEHALRQVS